jgi:hypothetical protein
MGIESAYQIALFEILDGAKATLGVNSVHDIAPQKVNSGNAADFPYIVMGRIFAVANDTQTKNGFAVTSRIHTYSRSGALLECKTIQGKIYDLLHRADLTVTGFNSFLLLRSDSDCIHGRDTEIHGVCEYRGLVEYS